IPGDLPTARGIAAPVSAARWPHGGAHRDRTSGRRRFLLRRRNSRRDSPVLIRVLARPFMPTTDKVAIVTGAGTGIGKAAALALVSDGWRVVFDGRGIAHLNEDR